MGGSPGVPISSPAAPPARGLARPVEMLVAFFALLFSAPVIALASAAIVITSGPPALFRQKRIGRNGRTFSICKLRTMRPGSVGPEVTGSDDPRITRIGKLLRDTKIDEIPQFWNVLRGEMSLVGPRPEVPRYVDLQDPLWKEVLQVRPGMTDPVAIRLLDEELLLAEAGGDRERFYREQLLPLKLEGYVAYIRRRSWLTDLQILGKTVAAMFGSRGPGTTDSN